MTMDDCPTKDDHSCLFDLDDFHRQIGVGLIFSSPSVAPLSKGRPKQYRIYYRSLDVYLYVDG